MKTIGIVGGIAPASTIEYYRLIIARYREQKRDGSYPPIIINSIDLKKVLDLIGAQRLAEVTEYLLGEVTRLGGARADFGLLASNTPHIVFEDIQRQSPIPLVSIVEATCQATWANSSTASFGPKRARDCTELPLILRDVADRGIPFLDTTRIHVKRAVAEMLLEDGA